MRQLLVLSALLTIADACSGFCCSATDGDTCKCLQGATEGKCNGGFCMQCGQEKLKEIVGEPCFPSDAKVTLAGGKPARLDALKEGDEVVAVTLEGKVTTDTVTLLSISKPNVRQFFDVLKTADGTNLTLTREHHVVVGPTCCSHVKKVKDVAVGETVYVVENAAAKATTVVDKLLDVVSDGLHSPVLLHGTHPVVDRTVTAFDSIPKVTLAKYGLEFMLKACKVTGTCDKLRDIVGGYIASA